ncbi:MAG: tape measure protein [Coriobacteriaceae bacterium]|nr:tape measure protein [Coriobacteriaceae bacterium]
MANVGTAQMTITPRFDNLSASVNKALSGVNVSSGSAKLGSSVSDGVSRGLGGLAKSGALVGAFSTITSKAMDAISSHVGSAVSRLDTLKNYPTVMSNLGVSSDEASTSIKTMSDRLSNLPTALNDMASTVQGLYTSARNYGMSLTDITNAGLGLNDMLLAGGQSQGIVNAAMEQFRQMVSKGKPDMQDWKSLVSAAPAQLDQLAKAMLGPTANATQLYYALGGGNEKDAEKQGFDYATISMDQLLNAISRLDTEGGEGIASFKEQAETAQGGVQTAMDNMSNAVTKGVEKIMDEVGRENIVGVINEVKGGINTAFGDLSDVLSRNRGTLSSDVETVLGIVKGGFSQVRDFLVSNGDEMVSIIDGVVGIAEKVAPVVSDIAGAIGPLVPAIVGVKVALRGLDAARSAFSPLASGALAASGAMGKASDVLLDLATKADGRLAEGLLNAAGAAGTLSTALSGPLGIGIGIAVAGIGLLVGKTMEEQRKQDALNESVQTFSDAMGKAADAQGFSGTLGAIGGRAHDATVSLDELNRKMDDHARAIEDNNSKAEEQVATLTTVQQVIDGAIGKTDLDSAAKGRLEWALKTLNDQTGLNITQEDVLAGKYADQDGVVHDLKQSVDDLTNSRIAQAKADALQKNLTEAYSAQADAAQAMATAQNAVNDVMADARSTAERNADALEMEGKAREDYIEGTVTYVTGRSEANKQLEAATADYERATDAIQATSEALGQNAEAAQEGADAYARLVATMPVLGANLEAAHVNADDFAGSLRALGADTDDLSDLANGQLNRLANDYDGTTASIVADLDSWNVGMDAAAKSAAEMSSVVADQLGVSASDLSQALEQSGISMDSFSQAMQGAGLSAEDMSNISQEQFSAMLSNCGGNLDALIMEIQNYNDQDILDKEGNVDVDTQRLVDAQGEVYTWNGTTLVDQNGQAVVDDVSLTDAQGNLWTWNGSSLVQQDGTAEVDDLSLTDAQGNLYTWNGSSLNDKDGNVLVTGNLPDALGWIAQWNSSHLNPLSGVVNIFQNIFSGGGDGNARGGIVRARGHATGAVFTKPTWISPTDYIGEDGPEYYDGTNIVPLTSKHGQPFANLIADEVVRKWGGPNGGATYNTYIDGTRINDDAAIQGAFMAFMGELVRISDMG